MIDLQVWLNVIVKVNHVRKGDNVNIAEFAFITGMSKSTIRYYEDQKLLMPKRNANGYRMYSDEDIQDARLITSLRKAGISLEDIRLLIEIKNKEVSIECKDESILFVEKQIASIEDTFTHLQIILKQFRQIQSEILKGNGTDLVKMVELLNKEGE